MMSPHTAGTEMVFLQNVMMGQMSPEEDKEIKDKCDEKVITWMKAAFQNKNLDMKVKSDKDLICILLDIILYQDSVLVNNAFTLLARYFSQKRKIIDYGNEVQLL